MHFSTLIVSALLAPLGALAAPVASDSVALAERQNRPPKPTPCVRMTPDPEPAVYKERFEQFADAFIYNKNISRAFEFIVEDYIVSLLRRS
jgi:hypothetical protein